METKTTVNTLLARVLRKHEFLQNPEIVPLYTADGMSLALSNKAADRLAADAIGYAIDWHRASGGLMDPGSASHPIAMARRRMKMEQLSDDQESLIFDVVRAALTEFNRNFFASRSRRRYR